VLPQLLAVGGQHRLVVGRGRPRDQPVHLGQQGLFVGAVRAAAGLDGGQQAAARLLQRPGQLGPSLHLPGHQHEPRAAAADAAGDRLGHLLGVLLPGLLDLVLVAQLGPAAGAGLMRRPATALHLLGPGAVRAVHPDVRTQSVDDHQHVRDDRGQLGYQRHQVRQRRPAGGLPARRPRQHAVQPQLPARGDQRLALRAGWLPVLPDRGGQRLQRRPGAPAAARLSRAARQRSSISPGAAGVLRELSRYTVATGSPAGTSG
jgi:hypothetical protein